MDGVGQAGEDVLLNDQAAIDVGIEGERPRKSARVLVVNIVRYLLIALVVGAAVYYIWRNWDEVGPYFGSISVLSLVGSFVAVSAGIACATMSWQVLVDDLGRAIGPGRGAPIFLVGQLGKYLPGTVWAYVLQLELGRKAGLARARVFAATIFSVAVAMVAALIAALTALPEIVSDRPDLKAVYLLYVLLPVALVLLHPRILNALARFGFKILRRPAPDHPVMGQTVIKSLLWAFGSYAFYGVHLWILARTASDLGVSALFLCIGTMATGMMAGLFAFFLPSGAGVREIVIITALSPLIGLAPATAFAAMSRVIFTVADLVTAGGAAIIGAVTLRRRGHYSGDPGIT